MINQIFDDTADNGEPTSFYPNGLLAGGISGPLMLVAQGTWGSITEVAVEVAACDINGNLIEAPDDAYAQYPTKLTPDAPILITNPSKAGNYKLRFVPTTGAQPGDNLQIVGI